MTRLDICIKNLFLINLLRAIKFYRARCSAFFGSTACYVLDECNHTIIEFQFHARDHDSLNRCRQYRHTTPQPTRGRSYCHNLVTVCVLRFIDFRQDNNTCITRRLFCTISLQLMRLSAAMWSVPSRHLIAFNLWKVKWCRSSRHNHPKLQPSDIHEWSGSCVHKWITQFINHAMPCYYLLQQQHKTFTLKAKWRVPLLISHQADCESNFWLHCRQQLLLPATNCI